MSNTPNLLSLLKPASVRTLTLHKLFLAVFLLASANSCSFVSRQTFELTGDECKTHAYIDNNLEEYITSRFGSKSQARLGIIPFSVQANFSSWGQNKPDWGYDLAAMLHQQILATGKVRIAEVLDRRDWPGKSEEFFSGNFGAIQAARSAGFDLVLVGFQETLKNSADLSISTKIIDTESGITVWYGKTQVYSYRPEIEKSASYVNLSIRRPDLVYLPETAKVSAVCIAKAISPEEELPKCYWPWC